MWVVPAVACERAFTAMGTEASMVLPAGDCDAARAIVQRVYDEVTAAMSPWVATSDVSRLNQARGETISVGTLTADVLAAAADHARRTGGLFDITFATLDVWRFDHDAGAPVVPSAEQIEQKRRLVDYRRVIFDRDRRSVRLADPRVHVSLNGIAKGYAVDRAAAALRAAGVRHFLLRLGGDLYASGRNGDRQWKVAIRDPRATDRTFAEMLVEDRAFSTSGDYERFFIVDGKRYHHIIDPRTGYPATKSRSATLLTKDCVTAEGLTKAVFIAGPEGMQALLDRYPGSEAVLVDQDGAIVASKGIKRALVITQPVTLRDAEPSATP